MLQSKIAMLAANPKLVGKLCDLLGTMPNVDFPTMGGHFFWETLAESGGWKLQKNKLTDHCRLLDPSNNRKAWGSEKAMINALTKLQPSSMAVEQSSTSDARKVYCSDCGERVPEGKFCKECGAKME
ncbi:hypothetical protein [Paenibacillus sp. sgz500958]|uniref:hypothetical protein n=1 Tax=Paenibacillus sp. sgz500958 TaxID=3242475 RepID=UPI0036D3862D